MKKVLFIDRDGTLITEPPIDFQVDSFEKLSFIKGVISNLQKIRKEIDYEFVMVTNQDGLGTSSFPEETFWPAHNFMLQVFDGEGITFDDVIIDKTMPHENAPTRKPGTALLGKYMKEGYNLAESYVIGDRTTDIQLAKNLGAKAIWFVQKNKQLADSNLEDIIALKTDNWDEVYNFLKLPPRKALIERNTKETKIKVELNLDGDGKCNISTGLGFFDHMLDQLGRHSGCDLTIKVDGDLHVDEHHTIEDTALAIGEAYLKALGNKLGIERYGFLLPMDEALTQVAIDFSGRPWLVWNAEFKREKIGDMPTEMFFHFFKSFSDAAKCNLNISATGDNEHHKIEGIFKALAKSIKIAVKRDINNMKLPSTKGVL